MGTITSSPEDSTPLTHSLHEHMRRIVPNEIHPERVIAIPDRKISGTAFFPGGQGLYLEDNDPAEAEFPFGGLMVLGHNFDSTFGYCNSVRRTKEDLKQGTWRGLLHLLRGAGLPLNRCFFTNAFMGLCQGKDNRKYCGRTDQSFRQACLRFFEQQIEYQQPRMILTLGCFVPPFVAELSRTLNCWKRPRQRDPQITLREMDDIPIVSAMFDLSDGAHHPATVVPIAHPSYPNNHHRKPLGFAEGADGEIQIIRTAWTRVSWYERNIDPTPL